MNPDSGVLELLHKAASHPFVHISAIALDSLMDATRRGFAGAASLLPVLQRRAIIPHLVMPSGDLTLTAHELCGVSFQEFERFRDGILTDFLLVCWKIDPESFMDSCTAAVEEFCFAQHISPELSLQLEAALFCVEVISREAMSSGSMISHPDQFNRIVSAIGARPAAIFSNPLTLSRMCLVIQQVCCRNVFVRSMSCEVEVSVVVSHSQFSCHDGWLNKAWWLQQQHSRSKLSVQDRLLQLANKVSWKRRVYPSHRHLPEHCEFCVLRHRKTLFTKAH